MPATSPQLGYGQRGEAPINAVNQWMRSQPWYQETLRAFGADPNGVHLNDYQKEALLRAAQAHGVVVDEGHDGQQIDDSGNFEAKGHGLRNTLIVAGIAAAALATAGAAGAFAGAGGGAGGAGAAGAGSVLPSVATTSAVGGLAPGLASGSSYAAGLGAAAGGGGAATGMASSSLIDNILKYGVPTAGSIVGGIVQGNAASNASEAQQRYLEEALAYQKSQDELNRARQTGLDTLAQQQDARNFSRLQGLDQYAQGQDTLNRKTSQEHYQNNAQGEAGRYGDFANNIAPFVASGTAANGRMAKLLGLDPSIYAAARMPGSRDFTPKFTDFAGQSGGGAAYVDPIQDAAKLSPEDRIKIDALLKTHNSSDTPDYWYGVAAQHGGFDKTGADWLNKRISIGEGAGKGYKGAA